MPTLLVYKTNPDAIIPAYQTQKSACFDLSACLRNENVKGYSKDNKEFTIKGSGSILINPGERLLMPTGLIFDIPEGCSVRIHPRSGVALKQGLTIVNCEGVVDEDYTNPSYILLMNVSTVTIQIDHGMRIAQGELVRDYRGEIEVTETKPETKTDRIGGMGSTGTA